MISYLFIFSFFIWLFWPVICKKKKKKVVLCSFFRFVEFSKQIITILNVFKSLVSISWPCRSPLYSFEYPKCLISKAVDFQIYNYSKVMVISWLLLGRVVFSSVADLNKQLHWSFMHNLLFTRIYNSMPFSSYCVFSGCFTSSNVFCLLYFFFYRSWMA